AFDLDGTLGVLDTHGWQARTFRTSGHDLSWLPDGRSLLFVQGCVVSNIYAMYGGDVQSISPDGHIHTLVSASHEYGGQIVSAAWAPAPSSVRSRPMAPGHGTV